MLSSLLVFEINALEKRILGIWWFSQMYGSGCW